MRMPTLKHFVIFCSDNDKPYLSFDRPHLTEFCSWFRHLKEFEHEMYYAEMFVTDHYELIAIDRLFLICSQLIIIDKYFNSTKENMSWKI